MYVFGKIPKNKKQHPKTTLNGKTVDYIQVLMYLKMRSAFKI